MRIDRTDSLGPSGDAAGERVGAGLWGTVTTILPRSPGVMWKGAHTASTPVGLEEVGPQSRGPDLGDGVAHDAQHPGGSSGTSPS